MEVPDEVRFRHHGQWKPQLKYTPSSFGWTGNCLDFGPICLPCDSRLPSIGVHNEQVSAALGPRARPWKADVSQAPPIAFGAVDDICRVVGVVSHVVSYVRPCPPNQTRHVARMPRASAASRILLRCRATGLGRILPLKQGLQLALCAPSRPSRSRTCWPYRAQSRAEFSMTIFSSVSRSKSASVVRR